MTQEGARASGGTLSSFVADSSNYTSSDDSYTPPSSFDALRSFGCLLSCSPEEAVALRAFEHARRPYYFLANFAHYGRLVSGYLAPWTMPRGDQKTFAALSNLVAKRLNYTLCYWDPTLHRNVQLYRWQDYCGDSMARAVLSCLLRVDATTSQRPSLGERISLAVAAACFDAGFMVRRDAEVAHRLRASIPVGLQRDTLQAAQQFASDNGIWKLEPYLGDEAHFYGSAWVEPGEPDAPWWLSPERWPGLLTEGAQRLVELVVYDNEP